MAHEITIRENGKAEFAYSGQAAWHGLGNELSEGASIDTWKKEAGLDWEVFQSLVTYQSMSGTHTFDDKRVLFRSDTQAPLSVVSSDYKVVQPAEILEFFRDLTELHGFKLSAAGSLFGGKRFWATASVGKTFNAVPEDEIKGYLLLVTSTDGSMSTIAKFSSTRTVCQNTLTVALNEQSNNVVKKTHASSWDPKSVKIDLGLVDEAWDKFSTNMKKLTEVQITDEYAQNYLNSKFYNPALGADEQSTQTYNKLMKLMNLYKNGTGSEYAPSTAYQLVQGVTEAYTHGLRPKQDPSRKFWEGSFGTADKIKSDVYSDMLALIA